MEVLYLLIPLSVILVFAIAVAFWRSVRGGQFDDLEGPGFKVLMDDDRPEVLRAPAEPQLPDSENEGDRRSGAGHATGSGEKPVEVSGLPVQTESQKPPVV